MPNSKVKCRYCKKYIVRDLAIETPEGDFCKLDHVAKYIIGKGEKNNSEAKRE